MNTESDLRAVLAEQARDISEPDAVLARLTVAHRPHRRRWVAPVAAAAAVAAVVAGATTLASSNNHHAARTGSGGQHTLPPMPGRVLQFDAAVGAIAGYSTHQILAGTYATTEVYLNPGTEGKYLAGEARVYEPGAYDARELERGQRITVQGHPAFFGTTHVAPDWIGNTNRSTPYATLGWEVAPNQWLTITGWNEHITPTLRGRHLDPLTEEKRVAAAIDTTARQPLLLPYRVGHLPAGLQRCGGMRGPDPDYGWTSYLFMGRTAHDCALTSYPTLSITVHAKARNLQLASSELEVDGHPATFADSIAFVDPSKPSNLGPKKPKDPNAPKLPKHLVVDFGNAFVEIQGEFPDSELIAVAHSMVLAPNPNDQSTWFDATK